MIDPALFQENERTAPASDERRYVEVGALACECGKTLESVSVAYQTWGELNADRSNAIFLFHALSGDSNAAGWWDRLVGSGKAFDTDRYFIICSNALGGCQGTTGPASLAPDGKPYGSRFPMITVGDMVEVQARLLDHLGIDTLLAVAGGSMGGMQALEWTVRFPNRVRKCVLTATSGAHGAMQIGFNEVGRQAILRDPNFNGGDYYPGTAPADGLSVARMLGHLSFLSNEAFEAKFGRNLQDRETLSMSFAVDFQVESYLNYQGDKFTARFDANSLIHLTKAIDYYEFKGAERSESEYLVVSYTSDWIYPTSQSVALEAQLREAGRPVERHEIELPYGHDAFLLDGEHQAQLIKEFLCR